MNAWNMSIKRMLFLVLLMLGMFGASVNAEIAGPGWITESAPLVSPSDVDTYYSSQSLVSSTQPQTLSLTTASVTTASSVASVSDPEITELARGLQNDPALIYAYVLNYIDYVPYYGHLRSAMLTLLERSGNDFDQAELLIALLRAAGYTAVFVHGTMTIPTMNAVDQRDMQHWMDVGPNTNAIASALANGGIPGTVNTTTTQVSRVWVRLTTNTGTYDLDPAFKVYERTTGINLAAAMGYDRASMIAAAAGASGTDYVQNLSEAGIDSTLTAYANNLATFLRASQANEDMAAIVGGSKIRITQAVVLPTSLPFNPVDQGTWTEIPAQFIHTVRVQMGSIDQTLNIADVAGKKLSLSVGLKTASDFNFGSITPSGSTNAIVYTFTDANRQYSGTFGGCINFWIQGDSAFSIVGPTFAQVPPGGSYDVVVQFAGNGASLGTKTAKLFVSGDFCSGPNPIISTINLAGTIATTASTTTTSTTTVDYDLMLEDTSLVNVKVPSTGNGNISLTVSVDHKFANPSFADQTTVYTVKEGSTYVIISDFGGSRDGLLLKKRQKRLEQYRADGLPDTSREVLTETLNVMGQIWMRQTALVNKLLAEITGTHVLDHHRFGLMAQETGYFVDVKTQFSSISPRNPPAGNVLAYARAFGFIGSALEHGVLEQLQGANFPVASTIKLLTIANNNGTRIYRADSSNFATIQSQLTGYSASTITSLSNLVNNAQKPATLLLPANGQIALQQWRGTGYVATSDTGTSFNISMIIGGGYFGGFGAIPATINPTPVFNDFLPKLNPVFEVPRTVSIEPIDLHTGAYTFTHTDIALGGAEPRGLRFIRYYDSDRHNQTSTMGHGWTHNYDMFLTVHSDAATGISQRQPEDAAAMLVAAVSATDLLSINPVAKDWTIAALTAKWATDQLFDNAVSVHIANQSLTYIKLPNGSYSAPPGTTTDLIKSGTNLYSLQERFGGTMDFNANKKISSWRDVDGNLLTFNYAGNKLSSVSDAFSHTLTFGYNGNLSQVTDSTGRTVNYSYNANDDLVTYQDSNGKSWSYSYNANHRMLSLSDPLTITNATNTYDILGRVNTQTVPRQTGTATFKYFFTDFRNIEEDPSGAQTVYFFDKRGRKVAVQDALGGTTSTEFDGENHAIKQTDARGNQRINTYDGNQNLVRTTDALLNDSLLGYDVLNHLVSIKDPLLNESIFTYDAEHHLVRSQDADGNTTSMSYLSNGFVNTTTDARNIVTQKSYDTSGNPSSVTVAAHAPVNFQYDAIGRMTQLTDQALAKTTFSYDGLGHVLSITDPLGKIVNMTYDAAGHLKTVNDRNGALSTLTYTPSGKTQMIDYPGTSNDVSFNYDQQDDLIGMSDVLGSSAYSYDALHRLVSQTDAQGFVIGYSYDPAGNLASLTYPGNKTVSYTYDALNQIKTVTDWLGHTATYSYDAAGRQTRLVNFNGAKTDYAYDQAGWLFFLSNTASDGTLISRQAFNLDGNGNRVQESQEVPQAPVQIPTDNVAFTYNPTRNRLTANTTDTFNYDPEGQQTAKSGTGYTFDAAHRLTAIGSQTQYTYDGAGNRLRATRNGVVTQYIYDTGGHLLAQADGSGAITRYYVYGAGLLALIQGNAAYAYHFDATGHTLALSNTGQALVNRYSYTPYGQNAGRSETISQPFQYVGQFGVMTEPDGVLYMRARYYDAATGRFISEDPIGFEGGLNLYAYVTGNPVMSIDPSGTCGFGDCIVAGLLAARAAAPIIARSAVAGFNAAKTFLLTNQITTTAALSPAVFNGGITVAEFTATTATNTAGPLSIPRAGAGFILDTAIDGFTIGNAAFGALAGSGGGAPVTSSSCKPANLCSGVIKRF